MLGLTSGSFEAFCLDQAVWYLGTRIQSELDKVGRKRDRKEVANAEARKRLMKKLMGEDEKSGGSGFADPAALFS
jgi:hypothetical protein